MPIDSAEWEDHEDRAFNKGRPPPTPKKKKRSQSLVETDRQDRKKERQKEKEFKRNEARGQLKDHLVRFVHNIPEDERREQQVASYIKWVKRALESEGREILNEKDVEENERPGKKSISSITVSHRPTLFKTTSSANMDTDQKRAMARTDLYTHLEGHFGIWRELIRNSSGPVNIGETATDILEEIAAERGNVQKLAA